MIESSVGGDDESSGKKKKIMIIKLLYTFKGLLVCAYIFIYLNEYIKINLSRFCLIFLILLLSLIISAFFFKEIDPSHLFFILSGILFLLISSYSKNYIRKHHDFKPIYMAIYFSFQLISIVCFGAFLLSTWVPPV